MTVLRCTAQPVTPAVTETGVLCRRVRRQRHSVLAAVPAAPLLPVVAAVTAAVALMNKNTFSDERVKTKRETSKPVRKF